jgi:UPF0716 family protein affecting phage T7 exclusion
MGIILLAAFIALPLIEIWVFIEIGAEIGAFSTIAVCVLTAVVGMAMLRAQGFATLMRARGQMDEGILPAKELFDGLCLLVAGAFLLTPGFVTDRVRFCSRPGSSPISSGSFCSSRPFAIFSGRWSGAAWKHTPPSTSGPS